MGVTNHILIWDDPPSIPYFDPRGWGLHYYQFLQGSRFPNQQNGMYIVESFHGSLLIFFWEDIISRLGGAQESHQKFCSISSWQFFVTLLGWWKRDPFKGFFVTSREQNGHGLNLNHLVRIWWQISSRTNKKQILRRVGQILHPPPNGVCFGVYNYKNWLVLSDEQMSNEWPFSLLNDEQMSKCPLQ